MRANCGLTPGEYLFFSLMVLLLGCSQPDRTIENDHRANHEKRQKELLMEHNRLLIAEEMSRIDAYVQRVGWRMDTTSTGLKYMRLDETTSGRKARLMDKVALTYSMSLLDGTPCYSSDSTGRMELILGQSAEPAGLQQGVLQLHEGESALLIVPSYLAFGLTGDGNCVPGSSSIVYKVRLDTILERQP
jgi:FKBP-type peptidyl-prolyl cis-trans isomerase